MTSAARRRGDEAEELAAVEEAIRKRLL